MGLVIETEGSRYQGKRELSCAPIGYLEDERPTISLEIEPNSIGADGTWDRSLDIHLVVPEVVKLRDWLTEWLNEKQGPK